MTPDDLRAIVAGEYETVQSEYFVIGVPPTPTERILAATLLAVLERCDGSLQWLPHDIRQIITEQLKEGG